MYDNLTELEFLRTIHKLAKKQSPFQEISSFAFEIYTLWMDKDWRGEVCDFCRDIMVCDDPDFAWTYDEILTTISKLIGESYVDIIEYAYLWKKGEDEYVLENVSDSDLSSITDNDITNSLLIVNKRSKSVVIIEDATMELEVIREMIKRGVRIYKSLEELS
ncbi:MAG: hypothetical protein FWC40_04455 [Proteobacteria bacterium]|nr:hypothetical protein [Pseudomonadota bacterium]